MENNLKCKEEQLSNTIFYKAETELFLNLEDEFELNQVTEWIRKDHKINIFLGDEETNEEIGFIEIALFNLTNFKDNEECIVEAFDDEQETYDIYALLQSGEFPKGLIETLNLLDSEIYYHKGCLVCLKSIWIDEEYRNKQHGSYTIKNLETIINYLFNIKTYSIVGELSPMVKVIEEETYEETFDFIGDIDKYKKLETIFRNNNFKFLDKKKYSDYFYKII